MTISGSGWERTGTGWHAVLPVSSCAMWTLTPPLPCTCLLRLENDIAIFSHRWRLEVPPNLTTAHSTAQHSAGQQQMTMEENGHTCPSFRHESHCVCHTGHFKNRTRTICHPKLYSAAVLWVSCALLCLVTAKDKEGEWVCCALANDWAKCKHFWAVDGCFLLFTAEACKPVRPEAGNGIRRTSSWRKIKSLARFCGAASSPPRGWQSLEHRRGFVSPQNCSFSSITIAATHYFPP